MKLHFEINSNVDCITRTRAEIKYQICCCEYSHHVTSVQ